MDWHELYFGHVSPKEVQQAIKDSEWQDLRRSIKGVSLAEKHRKLTEYKLAMNERIPEANKRAWRMVEVRLTNYVTALSRGGLIKPSDYR